MLSTSIFFNSASTFSNTFLSYSFSSFPSFSGIFLAVPSLSTHFSLSIFAQIRSSEVGHLSGQIGFCSFGQLSWLLMIRHFISFFRTAFRVSRSSWNSSAQSWRRKSFLPLEVLEDSISDLAFFISTINSSSSSSLGRNGGHSFYLSSKLYSFL